MPTIEAKRHCIRKLSSGHTDKLIDTLKWSVV